MPKNKKNPNKIVCTMADIKKYQRQVDEEWEQRKMDLYVQAAQWASAWYQSIAYKILCEDFGFTVDDLNRFQDKVGVISDRITSHEGEYADYTLDTVREELEQFNVFIDTEDLGELK